MLKWIGQLQKFDWVLAISAFLLVAIGIVAIYSIEIARGGDTMNGQKQLASFAVGFVLFIAAGMMAGTLYRATAFWWYLVGLLLLAAVLVFGTEIRGTRGWFQVGGFSFQPVEFMKVGLVLLFAKFASRQERYFKRFGFFSGSAVLVAVPILLVLFQPDLGSAMVLGLFWLCMMVLLRVKWSYLISLGLLAVVAASIGWLFVLKPYQKDRLLTFVNPSHDPLGAGYNIQQSLIAVGSGRWFGRGLGFGSQSQLRFLPESQTDFIFAMVAETFGLAGSLVLIGLFALLWHRLSRMMLGAQDDFSMLVLAGALIMLAVQWFVNICATVGLLPVTGIPMPLVSYGGSSLASMFLLLGIAQSMYASRGISG